MHLLSFSKDVNAEAESMLQTKEAWKYSMCPALGRDLAGYAARCGDIADNNSVISFGCGTSLADVHYHCAHCVEAEEEAAEPAGLGGEAGAGLEEGGEAEAGLEEGGEAEAGLEEGERHAQAHV